MSISLAAGLGPEPRVLRSSRPIDELEDVLELAKHLRDRICASIDSEQRHGVRMRLVRAQALSIVDLLTDLRRGQT